MRTRTLLLAIAHGSVDLFQGAVPVLVPFLVAERGYGYVAVSGLVLAASLLSSVVQPVFGLWTDRRPLPWLAPAGLMVAGLGIALAGLAHTYWLTFAAVALSGLGVAAYHPEAARLARAVTGGDPVGMSTFSVGGNIGFALAPALAAPVLALGGLAAAPLLLVISLVGLAATLPLLRVRATGNARGHRTGTDDWRSFRTLSAVVVLRSIGFVGLSTFLGLYVGSAAAGSVALFVLYAGGAVGTVLGGRLARRWGRTRVLRTAYASAVPAVLGIALVPGPAAHVFIAAAAIALSMPFSLHVTLGQDYLPARVGTASGVTLGLAVSAGGAFAPVLGALADATSLQTVLAGLAVLPALACLLARRLPEPETVRPAAPADVRIRG
ncbi:FSR family fosmidomycin resistance protein-like MFS transporter [Crossiella equi]|uniref:FSR family fosmidomycin resistance protein-like MFS transporter n=1 Tax=Crossiella equi TaxID=130796 RepID=A0ABS5A936_9PSEU|nr:MFS transporter [Crossiella equi]MBP2473081.1 FSR family fosmidomycin resistance protein-like MFS transporter [Crossiella equi]